MSQYKYLDYEGLTAYNNKIRSGVLTFRDTENRYATYRPGDSLDLSSGVYYATTSKTATRVSNPLTIKTLDGDIVWNGSDKATIDFSTNWVIVKGAGENSVVLKNSDSTATGEYAVSLGYNTEAKGHVSHAEGGTTKALSEVAHAEGLETISGRISQIIDPATGNIRELTNEEISILAGEALRIGLITTQSEFNTAVAMKLIGFASHAEGSETKALGTSSHAEGNNTEAASNSSHAEGDSTHAWGEASHSEGYLTEANGNQSHSEGKQTKAQGNSSHAEGIETQALKEASHAEGTNTIANGNSSHAEGIETQVNGWSSHAEGGYNITTGSYSHIEGRGNYIGDNDNYSTEVADIDTKAYCAHSEGQGTKATGNSAHAEGVLTKALGISSHAEGYNSIAGGNYSHAGGLGTKTTKDAEFACGKYNNSITGILFSVGAGQSDDVRYNAFEVHNDGTAYCGDSAGIYTVITSNNINRYLDQYVNAISITYSELKTKRDNGLLIPGTWYEITDYVTTTSQENTTVANRHFNILVLAASNRTLSEEAKACESERLSIFDNYNIKFDAWKLWYCLDNDTSRFAWADTDNGKGVIYRMIDEWGNDCPYDFKNIQFINNGNSYFTFNAVSEIGIEDSSTYIGSVWVGSDSQNGLTKDNKIMPNIVNRQYRLPFNIFNHFCQNNYIGYNSTYNIITWQYNDGYMDTNPINNIIGNKCHHNIIAGESNIILEKSSNNIISGERNRIGRYCNNIYITDPGNINVSNWGDIIGSSYGEFSNIVNNPSSQNIIGDYCNNILIKASNNNRFENVCSNIQLNGHDNYGGSGGCHGNIFNYRCSNIELGIGCIGNVFMQKCNNIAIYTDTSLTILKGCCCHNIFAPNCSFKGYNGNTSYESLCLRNYYFNIQTDEFLHLEELTSDNEIRVEKNSNGVIKKYKLVDLIA